MKKLFIGILVFISLLAAATTAKAASGDLFTYPSPPDTMVTLEARCNFIVSRFWDRCNFGTAFKSPAKLNAAFGDWIAIMPYANADTVYNSIDKLLARFEKKGPETLSMAMMAENWLYSDTAEMRSTEVYLPFARAAVSNKKISKAEKARFESHVKIIESSSVGSIVPDIPIIYADGSKGSFASVQGASILLFFNDPDCMDCNFARIRLSADPNTRELVERGELTVVSIFTGDIHNDGWQKSIDSTPQGWLTVAMPDADVYFDLRRSPLFSFLNARHRVLVSNLDVDYLLGVFRTANTQSKNKASEQ